MKILISGAAGFLGRNFLKFYDTEGNSIDAVDDMSNAHSRRPVVRNGWFYKDDIRNYLSFDTVKKRKYDVFFHFAAPVGGRDKIENDPLFNAESLSIDSKVFRWSVGRVGTLVYPSSSAVYPVSLQTGRGGETHKLVEDDFRPWFPEWGAPDLMYGFTKLAGEVLAYTAFKQGLNVLVLRPFSGYGEGQSQEYPFPSLMRRIANHEDPMVIWGNGNQVRDFIHVDDIVRSTDKFIQFNTEHLGLTWIQQINLCTGVGTSFNELVDMAFDIEGIHPEVRHMHDKPMGVMDRVGSPKVMISRAGDPQVTLEEGIKRMLDFERGKK